MLGVMPSLH
jgi:hypothetical protein